MTSVETNTGSVRRVIIFLPLVVLIALAILFYVRLGAGDASRIPSALLGKPAPAFQLPPPASMPEAQGFSQSDLQQGHVTLVNVFASWCVPCHEEHPILMQLANDADLRAKGVRIFGMAYKDEAENTRRFLGAKGDPYAQIGDDSSGRVGIDWGVYGVPETFIVRGDGTIAYKFVGPLTEESMQAVLLPELKKALQ
ncbi:DsbE family thiol:disulfide interchange protein [Methylovirgula sp. 4M-Z18]|uniref:DsbE family thiol:disulfide interchange protein n=1 Tax=Methylovirgula sp. 4M-Z18 TaxID=2293567 RepID=UPI000E2F5BD1|nr:DsbE family thiol:disulfide interchange protein [Methylovirgula sp. 4M-Z18]RFB78531.1 DsbE family thiol:disulfide interchange protein [Methylovirgula sp. 4M-Z18]